MDNNKPHSRLLDVFGVFFFLAVVYVIAGYGMDLEAGRPRNPIMDRLIIVWAIGMFFVLVIWWIRSDGGRK